MKKLPLVFAFTCVLAAQDKVDEATSARIRSEELEHSMIMHTEHMLTDRFGPRMTGTPNHEAAVDWVIKETTAWGMKNAHKEAWDFGHPGWLNERASGFITAPVKENLKFEVLAWTPSTKGTVTGSAIQLIPPRGPEAPAPANAAAGGGGFGGRGGPQFLGPTQAQMDQWIAQVKSSVRGKMVL
ncbi:MAG: peptidase M28, partial [Bryobacteraceae bacterium]